jgi:hypothetical protein
MCSSARIRHSNPCLVFHFCKTIEDAGSALVVVRVLTTATGQCIELRVYSIIFPVFIGIDETTTPRIRRVQSTTRVCCCLVIGTLRVVRNRGGSLESIPTRVQSCLRIFIHYSPHPHTNGLGSCVTCIVLLLATVCIDILGSVFVRRLPPLELPDSVR